MNYTTSLLFIFNICVFLVLFNFYFNIFLPHIQENKKILSLKCDSNLHRLDKAMKNLASTQCREISNASK